MKKIIILLVLLLVGCSQQAPSVSEEQIQKAVEEYLAANIDDTNNQINAEVNIDINDLNDLMVTLINQVDKSVVGIITFDPDEYPIGSGSGVIYKFEEGFYYAVTNHHVVEASDSLEVYFYDESYVSAEVVGVDSETDLAVIKFETDLEVSISDFGVYEDITRGQLVIAVGSPSGLTFLNSTTMGIVSGTERYVGIDDTDNDGIDDVFVKMIQHDAAINPGNSGGPLFNMQGEIIGINSLKLVSANIEGMGFSIPVDIVIRVSNDLEEYGEVKRSRLGVYIGDVRFWDDVPDEIERGCYISDIVPDGPVDTTSDLEIYDVIVGLNDVEIDSLSKLKDELFKYHPGEVIEIRYYRDGEYYTTTVVLGEK